MKILVVTPRYFPEQFSITNICEEMVKMGHEVVVLTGKPNYGYSNILPGYKMIESEVINNVKVIRTKEWPRKKGSFNLLLNYISIFFNYKRKILKLPDEFDVVLSHNLSPVFSMRGIRKYCNKFNIPHVHYGLDLWPESLVAASYFRRSSLIFKIVKEYSKKLYSSCDCICFASPSTELYFKDYLRIKNLNFVHIYQPCLTTPPAKEEVTNHEFMNNGKLEITYCGSIARFHRLDLLVEAVFILSQKNIRNVHINIVGSGSEMDKILELVSNKNLQEYFTFYGRVPASETKKYYYDSDVLYVPLENKCATSKMIPQKLIEYLMYARPILGMLTGDGYKLLSSASSGNAFSCQSSASIAESIEKLLSESKENLALTGKENRHFFDSNKRFSLETVCNELIDVCEKTINEYKKKKQ